MDRRNFLTALSAAFGLPAGSSANSATVAGTSLVTGTTRPSPSQGQPVPAPPHDPSLSSLESWLRLPIQPVWESPEPHLLDHPDPPISVLLHAIRNRESLIIRYCGGSDPSDERLISPALVFLKFRPDAAPDPVRDPHYVLAWCHRRNELRAFRLDRLDIPWDGPSLP